MTDSVCCLNYCSVLGLCLPFLRRVSLPPLLYLTPSHPHSTSRALLFPLLLVTSLSDPCPPLLLRPIAALPHYCLEVKKNRPTSVMSCRVVLFSFVKYKCIVFCLLPAADCVIIRCIEMLPWPSVCFFNLLRVLRPTRLVCTRTRGLLRSSPSHSSFPLLFILIRLKPSHHRDRIGPIYIRLPSTSSFHRS
jgi:hypothetical protein